MESLELKAMIRANLDEINDKIDEFIRDNQLEPLYLLGNVPLEVNANDIIMSVDQLIYADTAELRRSKAFCALASLGALNSQLSCLATHLNLPTVVQKISQAAKTALNSLKKYLQSLIQSISAHLWQLISNLLTLKEWSVSGNAGVNLFGLSGTVEMELTFS